jgi:transposase InsO family protein
LTAAGVAKLFMDNIYKLHGLPSAIISDRDRIFTSRFWQLLFKLAGTSLHMSSAYHPQSDGRTERVNQCLETFLHCFVNACPSQWIHWLSLAEYWYNTSSHSALGRSPFEVLYGFPPRHMGVPSSAPNLPELSRWLEDRQLMLQLVRQHLLRAQARMKRQADKRRSERSFSVGDMVFVKLQPYVQSSVARRAHHKLAFRFFGPYRVLARIGHVAYRLELPPSAAVHPVFHVSQLKASAGDQVVSSSLPTDLVEFQVPAQVL